MKTDTRKIYIISSCLTGLCTRYDGKLKKNDECLQLLANDIWLPVCPEQLGGLPTPREAADIVGGTGADVLAGKAKVLTKSGIDVTKEFVKGAAQVLLIAQQQNISAALLKAGSPSCGVGKTLGVTAALLQQNNIDVKEF